MESIYENGGFIGATFSIEDTSLHQIETTVPRGEAEFTTPGTFSWTAPEGVTSVSVVSVGAGGGGGSTGGAGGGGGGGGGLGWKNTIAVVPGNSYTVVVGAGGLDNSLTHGGDSYFIDTSTVAGFGGFSTNSATGGVGGGFVGDGGGNGGSPSNSGTAASTGGGGAGGYSGNGGGSTINTNGQAGSGGGGGGGGAGGSSDAASGGGGVGIYGEGASGAGGVYTVNDAGAGGGGGSGGTAGAAGTTLDGNGGSFGGGGGGAELNGETGAGAGGAVRIIWGGERAFPSTNTVDGQGTTTVITTGNQKNSGIWSLSASLNQGITAQDFWVVPGTYAWTVPEGVNSVSAVCIGGGQPADTVNFVGALTGGAGGGLGWKNNIPVTPGDSYTVVVGGAGEDSYFINSSTVAGLGATGSLSPGGYLGDGGGTGGIGGSGRSSSGEVRGGGGGGAGGYSGSGGAGSSGVSGTTSLAGGDGIGGAGGGGSGGASNVLIGVQGGTGGGVSFYGEGTSGVGGAGLTDINIGNRGENGSAGALISPSAGHGRAGSTTTTSSDGGWGSVRLIWGRTRAFPAKNTQDIWPTGDPEDLLFVSSAQNTVTSATRTFSSVNIGSARGNKRIYIAITGGYFSLNTTIFNCSLNGVNATLLSRTTAASRNAAAIYAIDTSSGGPATVAVTLGTSVSGKVVITVIEGNTGDTHNSRSGSLVSTATTLPRSWTTTGGAIFSLSSFKVILCAAMNNFTSGETKEFSMNGPGITVQNVTVHEGDGGTGASMHVCAIGKINDIPNINPVFTFSSNESNVANQVFAGVLTHPIKLPA